jgi:hypothetical protein
MNHEFVADYYRPARCMNCGERREHTVHSKGAPHMIDAKQIPKEVWLAAWEAYAKSGCTMSHAIAAALNAWPGVCIRTRMQPDPENGQWILPEKMLSLPLRGIITPRSGS